MPRAIQTIAGFATGGAAGTFAATAAAGDSFTVKSFTAGNAYLESVFANGALTDWVRVRSPRMHDANQNLKLYLGTTLGRPLLPEGADQILYSADTPTVEIDVTAAGSGGILLNYEYDNLDGASPLLDTWDGIRPRIKNLYVAETDLAGGAIGAWSNSVALNSTYDDFHAGAQYAILGYICSAACLGVKITGPDTGNLGIGGPGNPDPYYTKDYFVEMSNQTGRPWIPIIAANNKQATLAQNVDSAANTAVKVSWILAELQ